MSRTEYIDTVLGTGESGVLTNSGTTLQVSMENVAKRQIDDLTDVIGGPVKTNTNQVIKSVQTWRPKSKGRANKSVCAQAFRGWQKHGAKTGLELTEHYAPMGSMKYSADATAKLPEAALWTQGMDTIVNPLKNTEGFVPGSSFYWSGPLIEKGDEYIRQLDSVDPSKNLSSMMVGCPRLLNDQTINELLHMDNFRTAALCAKPSEQPFDFNSDTAKDHPYESSNIAYINTICFLNEWTKLLQGVYVPGDAKLLDGGMIRNAAKNAEQPSGTTVGPTGNTIAKIAEFGEALAKSYGLMSMTNVKGSGKMSSFATDFIHHLLMADTPTHLGTKTDLSTLLKPFSATKKDSVRKFLMANNKRNVQMTNLQWKLRSMKAGKVMIVRDSAAILDVCFQ
jgi:hypothetical protein